MPRSSRCTCPTSRESPTRLHVVSPARLREILIIEVSDVSDGGSSGEIEREDADEDEEIGQEEVLAAEDAKEAALVEALVPGLIDEEAGVKNTVVEHNEVVIRTAIKIDTAAP
ncbi:hypothetical protein BD626DRAFT_571274 [Schizophyllum amplum]|uniref:Uncharacterized protein n=1 Tax=Schizophyllum amplum TaxID=97359 RepID=A0A550C7Z1_9AGAR|nr:hypothetical protein BD626DRAFT_571274 [Auriculariopsis ampla]